MQRVFYIILCLLLLGFTGCSGGKDLTITQKDSTPVENVNPPQELPQNLRAISAYWQDDDQLIYHTEQGLFAYSPAKNTTKTLLLADPTRKGEAWVTSPIFAWYYGLSPDQSKYILVTGGQYKNTLEIRDTCNDNAILILEYANGIGQAGWFDNEHIYFSVEYDLFIANVLTGEKVQVTADSTSVVAKGSPNTELPYLSWSDNVKKIGDKLYYYGNRDLKNLGFYSIYRGDKRGEELLLENAILLISVVDQGFIYFRETKRGGYETFFYDLESGRSTLITKEYIHSEGIFLLNDGKIAFMIGETTGGIYQGVIFNPLTLEQDEFEIYNSVRDFPDPDIEHHQFGRFMGTLVNGDEYVFIFSVEHLRKTGREYKSKYLAYSTKTKKLTEMADYGYTWLVNMQISPSGKYIVITKHNRPGDEDFPLDVIKSQSLLIQ